MCDCNGDGLATLSAFLEREAKKAQNSSCMKLVFFHAMVLVCAKKEEVYG